MHPVPGLHPGFVAPDVLASLDDRAVTIGSLFSGIGGLELGLEMCGLGPVVWQAESDPHARAVLAKHWPTARRYDDVREIDGSATRVDMVCGGFPCQPVSYAGLRGGASDERWLWPEFRRIVAAVRPRAVFVENVPGLRTLGLRGVLADLAGLGFDAEWATIGACQAGRPHTRDRLFVLAYANQGASEGRFRPRPPAPREIPTGTDREMPTSVRMESDGELQRMADGLPRAVERLRQTGNACSPQQAAYAYQSLSMRMSTCEGTR